MLTLSSSMRSREAADHVSGLMRHVRSRDHEFRFPAFLLASASIEVSSPGARHDGPCAEGDEISSLHPSRACTMPSYSARAG